MADERFQQRLTALNASRLSAGDVQFLSDITREQQAQLRAAWPAVPVERRRRVITELVELAELSVELDFRRVFTVALDDADGAVRAAAIEGLWEDESLAVLRRLVDALEHDPAEEVRVAAVRSLARFALRAVHGDLDAEWSERLRSLLLTLAEEPSASPEVRRRAVEAVAAYPNDDRVHAAIERAYGDRALRMRASALYAMGRNLDPRWLETVLDELHSDEAMLRYEAARASGELGSQRAVPLLLDLLNDPDREAQLAAVAALGKIGGRAAGTALRKLLQSDDEPLREAAEDALDELNFTANPLTIG